MENGPYWHPYNNYVKIVSTSTRQTEESNLNKLKKVLIKEKHLIRIIFHVNEESHARPLFQELTLLIYTPYL